MTHTLLFILVVGIGFYYAIKYGNKAQKDIAEYHKTESQTQQNHFTEMRNMAFSVTAEQLGLEPIETNTVYGIISEMDTQGTTVTVVTFLNGDTSVYMSSGAIIIGAGQHESVKKVVATYLEKAQNYITKATATENTDVPKRGMTNFNFLTKNSVYKISESLSALESGTSKFANLFAELNKVITEVRLKSE